MSKLSERKVREILGARGWRGTARERLAPYCPNCHTDYCRRPWCWFLRPGYEFDPEELHHWNPDPNRMPGADEFFAARLLPLLVIAAMGLLLYWGFTT
jgi:hypothetical protein